MSSLFSTKEIVMPDAERSEAIWHLVTFLAKDARCQIASLRSASGMTMKSGFSLLELLITIMIISILAAITTPLYSEHIASSRRFEAEMTLTKLANTLENYYFENDTYKEANLDSLGFPETIANYQLAIDVSDEGFQLSAIPLDKTAKCGTLLLNSSGEKNISGPEKLAECWS